MPKLKIIRAHLAAPYHNKTIHFKNMVSTRIPTIRQTILSWTMEILVAVLREHLDLEVQQTINHTLPNIPRPTKP